MTAPTDDHNVICRDPHMPNIGTHGRASGYSWVHPHCNQCGWTLSKERLDGMVACPRCAALLAPDNVTHPCLKIDPRIGQLEGMTR